MLSSTDLLVLVWVHQQNARWLSPMGRAYRRQSPPNKKENCCRAFNYDHHSFWYIIIIMVLLFMYWNWQTVIEAWTVFHPATVWYGSNWNTQLTQWWATLICAALACCSYGIHLGRRTPILKIFMWVNIDSKATKLGGKYKIVIYKTICLVASKAYMESFL